MILKVYEDVVAELGKSPLVMEFCTLFGKPVIILQGIDEEDIELKSEYAVLDTGGVRNLNVSKHEDDTGLIIFLNGLPEGHEFDSLVHRKMEPS